MRGVVFGHHTAALEGTPAAPLDDEPLAEDAGRAPATRRSGSPTVCGKRAARLAGDVCVNAGGVLVERRFDIDDRGQRLVLDLDEAGRVLGQVAAVRHDEGHRLADEADLVRGEGALRARSA